MSEEAKNETVDADELTESESIDEVQSIPSSELAFPHREVPIYRDFEGLLAKNAYLEQKIEDTGRSNTQRTKLHKAIARLEAKNEYLQGRIDGIPKVLSDLEADNKILAKQADQVAVLEKECKHLSILHRADTFFGYVAMLPIGIGCSILAAQIDGWEAEHSRGMTAAGACFLGVGLLIHVVRPLLRPPKSGP